MIFILLGLCCALFLIWRLNTSSSQLLEPPVISGKLPLIGHGHLFLGNGVELYNLIKKVSEECLTEERDGVMKIYFGTLAGYVVSDPENSLTIANTCLQKHYVYDFMRPLTANGLLNADVPTWIKNKKLLNPAFSQTILDSYIDIFNNQARRLVDQFANELDNTFDHENIIRLNNLETICATTTGADIDELDNLKEQCVVHFEEVTDLFIKRVQKVWLHKDFTYNISTLKTKIDKVVKQITLANTIIQQKKRDKINSTCAEESPKQARHFVDILLELTSHNTSFPEEQLYGEMNTIILAGHETIASTLTFTLTLLGSNADIQEKAFEEILRVIGKSNENLGKEDLSELVYIEAVIKETLRLYPSGPLIARQLDTDIKLKHYTLKANTGCFISIYGILRHKMWGPDANTFRPERWLEKETLPDPKYYAAFGLGRRACIGKVYGMMSMKIILAKVLQKYRISSDGTDMQIKMGGTIRPVSGHYISLKQRKL